MPRMRRKYREEEYHVRVDARSPSASEGRVVLSFRVETNRGRSRRRPIAADPPLRVRRLVRTRRRRAGVCAEAPCVSGVCAISVARTPPCVSGVCPLQWPRWPAQKLWKLRRREKAVLTARGGVVVQLNPPPARESESENSGPALAGQNPGSVFTEEIVRVGGDVWPPRVQGEACLYPSPAGERGVTLDPQLRAKENKE